jgi:hypothetical protein
MRLYLVRVSRGIILMPSWRNISREHHKPEWRRKNAARARVCPW